MSRKPIEPIDKNAAVVYLNSKLENKSFPSSETNREAETEFYRSTADLKKLNAWAEKFLSVQDWRRLRNAISRSRQTKKRFSVRLAGEAWHYLSLVAKHKNISMSDAVKKSFRREWEKIVRESNRC